MKAIVRSNHGEFSPWSDYPFNNNIYIVCL